MVNTTSSKKAIITSDALYSMLQSKGDLSTLSRYGTVVVVETPFPLAQYGSDLPDILKREAARLGFELKEPPASWSVAEIVEDYEDTTEAGVREGQLQPLTPDAAFFASYLAPLTQLADELDADLVLPDNQPYRELHDALPKTQ
jgi:hypothetical protein